MRRVRSWAGLILVTLAVTVVTGCGGGGRFAESTARAGRVALHNGDQLLTANSKDLTALRATRRDLQAVRSDQLTEQDWQTRRTQLRQLLRQIRTAVDQAALAALDGQVSSLQRTIDVRTIGINLTVVSQDASVALMGAMHRVTNDALRGVACDLLISAAFPNGPEPNSEPGLEANWQGNLVAAAESELARLRFVPAVVRQYLNWGLWVDDVSDGAARATATYTAEPDYVVRMALQPSIRRAAYLYAKTCHKPGG